MPTNREDRALRKYMAVAALCFATLQGCSESPPAESGVDTSAPTARSIFQATTAAFHLALRTDDADALFMHVAEDVVMMPPGEAAIRGKAAMRDWYAAFLSQFRTTSLKLTGQEVFIGKGWAVELGSYEWGLQAVAGGDPVVDHGSYMQVWRQQPNGQWQFAREIWNSSVPPAAPSTQRDKKE